MPCQQAISQSASAAFNDAWEQPLHSIHLNFNFNSDQQSKNRCILIHIANCIQDFMMFTEKDKVKGSAITHCIAHSWLKAEVQFTSLFILTFCSSCQLETLDSLLFGVDASSWSCQCYQERLINVNIFIKTQLPL